MIADESRAALIRAEAAYTDAAQRLQSVRREASEAQTRAHELHVELLRLSLAGRGRRPRAARSWKTSWPRSMRSSTSLIERRMTGEARFEELDMQLGETQERQAELEEGRHRRRARAVGRARAAARARAPGAGSAVQRPRAVGARHR